MVKLKLVENKNIVSRSNLQIWITIFFFMSSLQNYICIFKFFFIDDQDFFNLQ